MYHTGGTAVQVDESEGIVVKLSVLLSGSIDIRPQFHRVSYQLPSWRLLSNACPTTTVATSRSEVDLGTIVRTFFSDRTLREPLDMFSSSHFCARRLSTERIHQEMLEPRSIHYSSVFERFADSF